MELFILEEPSLQDARVRQENRALLRLSGNARGGAPKPSATLVFLSLPARQPRLP